MFATIFKAISSIGLVLILGLLLAGRDFTIPSPEKTITRATSYIRGDLIVPILRATTTQALAQESHNEPVIKENPVVESNPLPLPETPVVKEIPNKGIYVTMQEGQSDTVESYRPSISPCKMTMGYTIGRFDENFGISRAKFIEEIDAASTLWGNAIGKTLFVYNEKGPLIINLIYDERQARTIDVNNLALEIENSKMAATAIRVTYEQEKDIYIGDGEQLTKDVELFNTRYKIYADKVEMYNKQGGAPADIYNQMNQELQALKKISTDLAARKDVLLAYMENINTKVNRYNELVAYINSLIERSNSLGAKKFTEGRFSPSTNTIDIYQYNDLFKLRRVIAHELGHVLGINHTENMNSIMYAVNSATTTELGEDDLRELFKVCPR